MKDYVAQQNQDRGLCACKNQIKHSLIVPNLILADTRRSICGGLFSLLNCGNLSSLSLLFSFLFK